MLTNALESWAQLSLASSLHLRLKDYYAKAATHGAFEGAGDCRGQVAAGAYKDQTKENCLTKLTKEKDFEYKTTEAASLDKAVSD